MESRIIYTRSAHGRLHSTVVQVPPSWLFRHELVHLPIEGLLDTTTVKAFGDFWEVEFNHITCPIHPLPLSIPHPSSLRTHAELGSCKSSVVEHHCPVAGPLGVLHKMLDVILIKTSYKHHTSHATWERERGTPANR